MAEDQQNEALLKLKILNGEDLKGIRFLGKLKTFIVVWIDPQFKHITKTLTSSTTHPTWNYNFTFPLSLHSLQNPNSLINIQIISPSPIHHKRIIGSTSMSVSDIRFNEQVFTLQLWRPSGRAQGLIRVSARVEINLEFYTSSLNCVSGVPIESTNSIHSPSSILDQRNEDEVEYGYENVIPSAPPEDQLELVNDPLDLVSSSCPDDTDDTDLVKLVNDDRTYKVESVTSTTSPTDNNSNVLRSILVGFLAGSVAVATVLVGSSHS